MPEQRASKPPAASETFGSQIGSIARRYGVVRHKASITFGEPGEVVKAQREELYRDMIELTASTLLDIPEGDRRGILESAQRTFGAQSSSGGGVAAGASIKFLQDLVLETARLSEPRITSASQPQSE